jgi:gluconolactonase
LGKKKVLVDFGDQLGTDGMTVDTAGNIYAAVRSAKRFGIRVYNPAGKEIAAIATEVLPTNVCFGTGKEISTLYITAGTGLYRVKTNATGFHPALGKP